jgi:purine-binding chemotaxis protein CheW
MDNVLVPKGADEVVQAAQFGTGMQFLAFELANEHYAVDILRVVEIRGWTSVTTVPNTPDFIKGILNLRGTIVPIVDLRNRFDLDVQDYTDTTVVIVVSVNTSNGQKVIGMVVDAVSRVLNVAENGIKDAPDFGTAIHTEFIEGLATADDEKMVMILNLDRMLTEHETADLNSVQ